MSDVGGDPACWLERVCDDCGAFVEAGATHTCRVPVRPEVEPRPPAGEAAGEITGEVASDDPPPA